MYIYIYKNLVAILYVLEHYPTASLRHHRDPQGDSTPPPTADPQQAQTHIGSGPLQRLARARVWWVCPLFRRYHLRCLTIKRGEIGWGDHAEVGSQTLR